MMRLLDADADTGLMVVLWKGCFVNDGVRW